MALYVHLAITVFTSEGYFRLQSKILSIKPMVELLGKCSGSAVAGLTGKHKSRTSMGRSAATLQRDS